MNNLIDAKELKQAAAEASLYASKHPGISYVKIRRRHSIGDYDKMNAGYDPAKAVNEAVIEFSIKHLRYGFGKEERNAMAVCYHELIVKLSYI